MTTFRLISGGAASPPHPVREAARPTRPAAPSPTPVPARDFLRNVEEVSDWQPRQGAFIALILYRLGPGAGSLRPSTATLRAIASQVRRTLRHSDVVDVYGTSTMGVLLTGMRDVSAATVTALQVRGMVDGHPLLPSESALVIGQGMALAMPGSDADTLVAHAEAALDESWLSASDTLAARLVLRGVDGGLSATSFTAELVRVPAGHPNPLWVSLPGPDGPAPLAD